MGRSPDPDRLARLFGDFAPYRRRPAVRQFTEQAAGLLKR